MRIDHDEIQSSFYSIIVIACFVLAFFMYKSCDSFFEYSEVEKLYESNISSYNHKEKKLRDKISEETERYNDLKNKDTIIIEENIVTIYEDEDLAYFNY